MPWNFHALEIASKTMLCDIFNFFSECTL